MKRAYKKVINETGGFFCPLIKGCFLLIKSVLTP